MIIAGNHRIKTPGIAVAALIADTTKSDGECELRIWEGAGQAHSAAACVIPDVAETIGLLRLLAGSGTAGASASAGVTGFATSLRFWDISPGFWEFANLDGIGQQLSDPAVVGEEMPDSPGFWDRIGR